jgi:peptide/nickel transport system permease protein
VAGLRRSPVARLIARRLLLGVVTLWAVSVLVFAATQALPGNAAIARLTKYANPQALAYLQSSLHLNQPLPAQYWLWARGLITGHLGTSFVTGLPVSSLIGSRIGNTLVLAAFAAAIGFPLALSLGIIAAVRRGRLFDHVSAVALLGLAAIPDFVLAIVLILLLGVGEFHVFPAVSYLDPTRSVLVQLDRLVLPALTLALAITPYIARMIRASLIEVLESEYVAMARLKGLSERRVIIHHALRNGLGPTIQAIGIALLFLSGGVVVIETVFAYPGVGSLLVTAVQNRDIPVIQDLTILFTAVYVVINIVADVLVVLWTPRLRTGGG